MQGVEGGHDGMSHHTQPLKKRFVKQNQIDINQYVEGVLTHNRSILAKTITLIESNASHHIELAQKVMNQLLPHTGRSVRIGITGVPGAGKSTFIEALGTYLCDAGHRVAVLAVDPSSSITGGSILGDKTRMEKLASHPNAFIRPSPSGGALGGVNRKTRETMLLCEAAGYDVILVETIGVGQSEIVVRSMVDFFLLLVLTGAGDELQGMKKGIMELADAIIINKADGDNKPRALAAREEYNQILHYLKPATNGWHTQAYTCSAMKGEGISGIWNVVQQFVLVTNESGVFTNRRREQLKDWLLAMIKDYLEHSFFSNPRVKQTMPEIENKVMAGDKTVTAAVQQLIQLYENQK
nr:methylmalonyl Co-A mutase-associated GTPase MeaB [Bacillus sp. HMF5848]